MTTNISKICLIETSIKSSKCIINCDGILQEKLSLKLIESKMNRRTQTLLPNWITANDYNRNLQDDSKEFPVKDVPNEYRENYAVSNFKFPEVAAPVCSKKNIHNFCELYFDGTKSHHRHGKSKKSRSKKRSLFPDQSNNEIPFEVVLSPQCLSSSLASAELRSNYYNRLLNKDKSVRLTRANLPGVDIVNRCTAKTHRRDYLDEMFLNNVNKHNVQPRPKMPRKFIGDQERNNNNNNNNDIITSICFGKVLSLQASDCEQITKLLKSASEYKTDNIDEYNKFVSNVCLSITTILRAKKLEQVKNESSVQLSNKEIESDVSAESLKKFASSMLNLNSIKNGRKTSTGKEIDTRTKPVQLQIAHNVHDNVTIKARKKSVTKFVKRKEPPPVNTKVLTNIKTQLNRLTNMKQKQQQQEQQQVKLASVIVPNKTELKLCQNVAVNTTKPKFTKFIIETTDIPSTISEDRNMVENTSVVKFNSRVNILNDKHNRSTSDLQDESSVKNDLNSTAMVKNDGLLKRSRTLPNKPELYREEPRKPIIHTAATETAITAVRLPKKEYLTTEKHLQQTTPNNNNNDINNKKKKSKNNIGSHYNSTYLFTKINRDKVCTSSFLKRQEYYKNLKMKMKPQNNPAGNKKKGNPVTFNVPPKLLHITYSLKAHGRNPFLAKNIHELPKCKSLTTNKTKNIIDSLLEVQESPREICDIIPTKDVAESKTIKPYTLKFPTTLTKPLDDLKQALEETEMKKSENNDMIQTILEIKEKQEENNNNKNVDENCEQMEEKNQEESNDVTSNVSDVKSTRSLKTIAKEFIRRSQRNSKEYKQKSNNYENAQTIATGKEEEEENTLIICNAKSSEESIEKSNIAIDIALSYTNSTVSESNLNQDKSLDEQQKSNVTLLYSFPDGTSLFEKSTKKLSLSRLSSNFNNFIRKRSTEFKHIVIRKK